MSHALIRTSRFVRAAILVVKKRPQIDADFLRALELLAEDAFHPNLKTHKLRGSLQGSFACSVTYDVRIIAIQRCRRSLGFALEQRLAQRCALGLFCGAFARRLNIA